MTVQELVDWCAENKVSLSNNIAVRCKDDYFLTPCGVSVDVAYFGNCRAGTKWENKVLPLDADGYPDHEKAPPCIILNGCD